MIALGKDLLDTLLNEINMADPQMRGPIDREKDDGPKVGVCDDELLQRIQTLCIQYSYEQMRYKLDASFESDPTTKASLVCDANRYHHKSRVMYHLFWFLCREKYNLYGDEHSNLGIRRGWEIVANKRDEDDDIKRLLRILGGGD